MPWMIPISIYLSVKLFSRPRTYSQVAPLTSLRNLNGYGENTTILAIRSDAIFNHLICIIAYLYVSGVPFPSGAHFC